MRSIKYYSQIFHPIVTNFHRFMLASIANMITVPDTPSLLALPLSQAPMSCVDVVLYVCYGLFPQMQQTKQPASSQQYKTGE